MSTPSKYVSSDEIRALLASALSEMYRREVPQYGTLLELVSEINQRAGANITQDNQHRFEVERHGAIRLGTADELNMMRKMFAIMGMQPVGYYDLTVAGLPVHATCFRPLTKESLAINPFRVFTSLLRLDLVEDQSLRARAEKILSKRRIFTPRCIEMIDQFQSANSLPKSIAQEFVEEALETFRWHKSSTVDMATYRDLQNAHPLIADVVCFRGPHINHLTPRVVDIEAAQVEMKRRGLQAKLEIEGPPRESCAILLRQTSFLALEEQIAFSDGAEVGGKHKARFGEIEQRGAALTEKGRFIYDELIHELRQASLIGDLPLKKDIINKFVAAFPSDLPTLHREGLAYFTYHVNQAGYDKMQTWGQEDVDSLILAGILDLEPITYEDFLPVSAAGIFHSNIGDESEGNSTGGDRAGFQKALGCSVENEFKLYEKMQQSSLKSCLAQLARAH